MCVGKTNHKVPQSAKDAASFAAVQAGTHQETIRPLEEAEGAQLQDASYQAARGTILQGRANADAAGSELQAQRTLRSGMGQLGEGNFTSVGLGSGDITSTSQGTRTKGVLAGYSTGKSMTMSDRFEALKTGQGHARAITSGLAAASRNDVMTQTADAENEMVVGRALGGLAVTAGMGGYTAAKRAGDNTVASSDLSLLGRGLRGMGVGQQQQTGGFQAPQQSSSYGAYNAPMLPGSDNATQWTYQQDIAAGTKPTSPAPATSKWQAFKDWI